MKNVEKNNGLNGIYIEKKEIKISYMLNEKI